MCSRYIAVGLSQPTEFLDNMVGWNERSWGYFGDDGFVRYDDWSEEYGPRFTTGDTIGCGYRRDDQSIYFTKNGQYLGKFCLQSTDHLNALQSRLPLKARTH